MLPGSLDSLLQADTPIRLVTFSEELVRPAREDAGLDFRIFLKKAISFSSRSP